MECIYRTSKKIFSFPRARRGWLRPVFFLLFPPFRASNWGGIRERWTLDPGNFQLVARNSFFPLSCLLLPKSLLQRRDQNRDGGNYKPPPPFSLTSIRYTVGFPDSFTFRTGFTPILFFFFFPTSRSWGPDGVYQV